MISGKWVANMQVADRFIRIFIGTVLLGGLVMCVSANAQSDPANPAQPAVLSPTERAAATELFRDANQDRVSYHLPPLRNDPALARAAWLHAQRMVQAGTLSHQLPGEPDLIVRVQQAGIHCTTVAENVAEGSNADRINRQWMHSPSHRANLLDPRVNAGGVAVIRTRGGLFAVQDFARELAALTPSGQERQVASLLAANGLRVEARDTLARAACNGTAPHSRPRPRLVVRYTTADLSQLPEKVREALASGDYRRAAVGACGRENRNGFSEYSMVILLY